MMPSTGSYSAGFFRIEDRGDEPIQTAVAIIVSNGRAHSVFFRADARRSSAVAESAVVIVPEQPALAEVSDDSQIVPAVIVEVDEARRKGHCSVYIDVARQIIHTDASGVS